MKPSPNGGGFVFIYMKPFEIYLNETLTLRELLNTYLELRQHFQQLGFSENDLEKPPTYSPKMMRLFHKFGDARDSLLRDTKSYGFDITFNELSEYLNPLLGKINELTPLSKDGYSQRRNQRDED
jgi:hypothetical protein